MASTQSAPVEERYERKRAERGADLETALIEFETDTRVELALFGFWDRQAEHGDLEEKETLYQAGRRLAERTRQLIDKTSKLLRVSPEGR